MNAYVGILCEKDSGAQDVIPVRAEDRDRGIRLFLFRELRPGEVRVLSKATVHGAVTEKPM